MKRWGIVIVICLLLLGCSTKLVYDNLDWILIEYVEDFVELDDSQETQISDKLQLMSEWHKNEEIPSYIQHLDELIALDPHTFTLEDLHQQQEKFRRHSERLLERIEPEVFEIANQLSDEQADELMSNIRVRHTRYKKRTLARTEQEQREKYAERIEENLDDWLGSVTDEQQALITQWSQELMITAPDWIEHQTKMRIQINDLLAKRSDKGYFESKLNQMMFNSESFFDDGLQQKLQFNKQLNDRYFVQILNSTTPKQIKYYRQELQDWKEIALDIK